MPGCPIHADWCGAYVTFRNIPRTVVSLQLAGYLGAAVATSVDSIAGQDGTESNEGESDYDKPIGCVGRGWPRR